MHFCLETERKIKQWPMFLVRRYNIYYYKSNQNVRPGEEEGGRKFQTERQVRFSLRLTLYKTVSLNNA